ncbi:hypothetical protein SAMN05216429_101158 [Marinobacter persicus]|uniref:Uncharacterized protein n=1 Tax=Marinobacter persicus TaxID=930118 RepID=A0A1I3PDU3_9GAMM|nr:hypothetical protein SAMN05216429_101158 [Marinobacter persicus]
MRIFQTGVLFRDFDDTVSNVSFKFDSVHTFLHRKGFIATIITSIFAHSTTRFTTAFGNEKFTSNPSSFPVAFR